MPAKLLALGLKGSVTVGNVSYPAELRGWHENNYLIIDTPDTKGAVTPHSSCAVCFIRDGAVITFKSVVEFVRLHENGFMLIRFPAKYEKIEVRKNHRLKVRLPVSYSQSVSGKLFEKDGVVIDLSMNGVLMSHAEPLGKGDKIHLKLPLPNSVIENMESLVCNVERDPENPKAPYVTGIKFQNLPDAHMDKIKKHIFSQI